MKTFYGPVEYHDGDTQAIVDHQLGTTNICAVQVWRVHLNEIDQLCKTLVMVEATVVGLNSLILEFPEGAVLPVGAYYAVGIVAA
jgi:hypothetical protein